MGTVDNPAVRLVDDTTNDALLHGVLSTRVVG